MFKAWLNFRNTYVSYKSNNYINKFFHILYERLFHIHVVHLLVMYFKKTISVIILRQTKNTVSVKI